MVWYNSFFGKAQSQSHNSPKIFYRPRRGVLSCKKPGGCDVEKGKTILDFSHVFAEKGAFLNNDPNGTKPQDNEAAERRLDRLGRRIDLLMVAALFAAAHQFRQYLHRQRLSRRNPVTNEFLGVLDKDEIAVGVPVGPIVILTRDEANGPLRTADVLHRHHPQLDNFLSSRRSWTSRGVIHHRDRRAGQRSRSFRLMAARFIIEYAVQPAYAQHGQAAAALGHWRRARPRSMERRPASRFQDVAGQDEAKNRLSRSSISAQPAEICCHRCKAAQRARCLSALRHRQDAAGQGRGGRGQRAVLLHLRLGFRGDVRRRRRERVRDLFSRRRRSPRPSSSSTRSTPSAAAETPSSAATTSASRRSTSCSPRSTASTRAKASSFLRPRTGRRSSTKALLRAGRFDRRIIVDRPNSGGRYRTLLRAHEEYQLAEDVDLQQDRTGDRGARSERILRTS